MTDSRPLTFRPGDWAVDGIERVARVIRSYWSDGEELLDLSIYSHEGDRLGRTSPAMGGPKSYEPCCTAEHWERIAKPRFPLRPQWMSNGDGTATSRIWAGERLPSAEWVATPKVKKKPLEVARDIPPYFTKAEMQHLVELFEGANDPTSAAIGVKAAKLIAYLGG